MADSKSRKAVYIPIPNAPATKGDSDATMPNKLKIEVYHDDGGASLSGTRARGIKVRFSEIERYEDSLFEAMILFDPRYSQAYPLVLVSRFNSKKLDKVDEIVKANIEQLAQMWFAGSRSALHTTLLELVKGV